MPFVALGVVVAVVLLAFLLSPGMTKWERAQKRAIEARGGSYKSIDADLAIELGRRYLFGGRVFLAKKILSMPLCDGRVARYAELSRVVGASGRTYGAALAYPLADEVAQRLVDLRLGAARGRLGLEGIRIDGGAFDRSWYVQSDDEAAARRCVSAELRAVIERELRSYRVALGPDVVIEGPMLYLFTDELWSDKRMEEYLAAMRAIEAAL